MKKKVLGLLLGAMAISTFGAFAQTEQQPDNKKCEQTSHKCCKANKDKKDLKKGDVRKDQKGAFNPFEGIVLTAEQQQKIDNLKAERKAQKEAAKKERKEANAKERKEFDKKVEEILTPEQYKQFQSNCEKFKGKNKDFKRKADTKPFKGDRKMKEVRVKEQKLSD